MAEYKKKLIEVALPLEAINNGCVYEKKPGIGPHPRGLHLWWARRPSAACRAVLFASLVNDPSSDPISFPTEEAQQIERDRLFGIMEALVKWENSTDEKTISAARVEIAKATDGNLPVVIDPFCGGGSIPVEAQRLGLKAYASDLNPVAVLINKALIEIPPLFSGLSAVHPSQNRLIAKMWKGSEGLAADVLYYGSLLGEEASRRLGQFYPKVKVKPPQGNAEVNALTWLWARTVRCPNPVCGIMMPLVRSFALSTKKGQGVWVEPTVNIGMKSVSFSVKHDTDKPPQGTVNRKGAICLACRSPVQFEHIRNEGKAGCLRTQLLAIIADNGKGRIYCDPSQEHELAAQVTTDIDTPDEDLPEQALGFRIQGYGMTKYSDLFTKRQLITLTLLSDLISEVHTQVLEDALSAGMSPDQPSLEEGGNGATAYADAIATYLAFAVDRIADYNSSICSWKPSGQQVMQTFKRHAIPMTWDFPESNVFANKGISWTNAVKYTAESLLSLGTNLALLAGKAVQKNAIEHNITTKAIFSTDPPYYDNIGYADLSDFFYIWLRRSLSHVYPHLFSTLLVPKSQELVANPFRFSGSREQAKKFFEDGLTRAFTAMREGQDANFPMTVYYAFKQSESEEDQDEDEDFSDVASTETRASTGWETMLEALIKSGFAIVCVLQSKPAPLCNRNRHPIALSRHPAAIIRQGSKGIYIEHS